MSGLDKLVLKNKGPITAQFLNVGCTTFEQAALYVRHLPYHRNASPLESDCVLTEKQGTCSSKHYLLISLVKEQAWEGFQLCCGIFKMNAINTPTSASVLRAEQLNYLPEAHCYLYYHEQLLDFTASHWNTDNFKNDLLKEQALNPSNYPYEKVLLHQNFIKEWIVKHSIPYTLEAVWELRERCIHALSNES